MKYYNPATQTEAVENIHDIAGATKKSDMPAEAQEWFTRPARDGYEWKCRNGKWPEEVPIEPAPAATRRLSACAAIDHAAGNARTHFATDFPFVDEEYNLTYADACAWIDSGFQGTAPDSVLADPLSEKESPQAAAESIKAQGKAWIDILMVIRKLRLNGKEAVKDAPDDADFMAIAQPVVERLEGLWPED
ncbi:hypothetical protein NX722_13615 [Endozoicomonas gorgoniicola]|uniref:Uncharacterized protein n=1 Tax=Endozoicomonas gorgoniicola TaxID=1234144 RepID=A0ABT3MW85_9GAMM|nr:hypothetical protein [Endozoicomonas gorgoniicola]MCW7553646.1 hypothetical protein [Endozoicomonas gorgoniicola]